MMVMEKSNLSKKKSEGSDDFYFTSVFHPDESRKLLKMAYIGNW